jgi:hypothetical protein
VRGDSLRDLYAKTLAVLGLGLLAGAGAVVDYWPVGSSTPAISSPSLPHPEVPALTQNLDLTIPAPTAGRPRVVAVHGTIPARNVGHARFSMVAVEPRATESIAQAAAPLPALGAPIDSQWPSMLSASNWTQLAVDLEVAPPINAAPAPGIIGGALRKTKESLVRASSVTGSTIAVTGSTIADAIKGVGGAFKKVTPF